MTITNRLDSVCFSRARILGMTLVATLCLGLAANTAKADDTITLPGLTLKGAFDDNPRLGSARPPKVSGQIYGGSGTVRLVIQGELADGQRVKIAILDSLANLSKGPRTYKLEEAASDPGRGSIELSGRLECFVKEGSLTLKSFGKVGDPITGAFSTTKWNSNGDCAGLKGPGSFETHRAIDF